MTQALIRRAFESTLATWAAARSPALTVAWENRALNPQPTDAYLRVALLPAQTQSSDLGRVNRRYSGVFQVSIVAPEGDGPGAADGIVAELDDVFSPASPISVAGLDVWALQPVSAAPPLRDVDRWVVPCSVPYLADAY